MAKKMMRCARCGRRNRNNAPWFAAIHSNDVAVFYCPRCVSAEERAEALGAARAGDLVLSTPSRTVELTQSNEGGSAGA